MKSIKKIIQRNQLAQQENGQQLIKQQEQSLEKVYQLALKNIESAIRISDLRLVAGQCGRKPLIS